jgi:hypothetical protein
MLARYRRWRQSLSLPRLVMLYLAEVAVVALVAWPFVGAGGAFAVAVVALPVLAVEGFFHDWLSRPSRR